MPPCMRKVYEMKLGTFTPTVLLIFVFIFHVLKVKIVSKCEWRRGEIGERGRSCIFSMMCYRGHNIFAFVGGGVNKTFCCSLK